MSQPSTLEPASHHPSSAGVGRDGHGATGIEPSKQDQSPSAGSTPGAMLPAVEVSLTPEAIVERLTTASRRGRLAGFEKNVEPGTLFQMAAFGAPFDGVVSAVATPTSGGTRLTFSTRMKRKIPIVWCLGMIATVWPGVLLTDSFLANFEFARNWWPTWWWYMPLTVPFVPWGIWSPIKKSRAAIAASAVEMIEKVKQELAGGAGT